MRDRLAHHYTTLAFNNAWANHRMLRVAVELSREEFAAAREGFFPSLKATLNHIVTVDWYYVDALERGLRGAAVNADARSFFDPEEPFSMPAELRAAQRAVDRRLIDVCAGLDGDKLDASIGVRRRTGDVYESCTRLLAHLFQHQIHHRGQAHAMLSGAGKEPPQLDEFFCAGEVALRAHDFEELGFTEAQIWDRTATTTA